MILLGTLTGVIAIIIIGAILLYNAANNSQQATFVEEGDIKFIMRGKTLERTLVNVAGYYLRDGQGKFVIQVGKATGNTLTINDDNGQAVFTPPLPEIVGEPAEVDVYSAIVPIFSPDEERTYEARVDAKQTEQERAAERVTIHEEREKLKATRRETEAWKKKGFKPARRLLSSFEDKGVYWVSILYPYGHVHRFDVPRIKLKEYSLERTESIADLVEEEEPLKNADFLLWQFPRPIIVPSVEFKDLLQADIILGTLLQVVMPYRPVFAYKANFFPLLSSAIQSAVIDFCRDITLQQFIRYFKTGYAVSKGPPPAGTATPALQDKVTDFYLRAISKINGPAKMAPRGTIEEFGIWVRNAWVAGIIPDEKTEAVKNALQASGIKRMTQEAAILEQKLQIEVEEQKGRAYIVQQTKKGQGDLALAELQAKAQEVIGHGDAAYTRITGAAQAKVLTAKVDGAGVAATIAEQTVHRVAALKGTGVTQYVEGGSSVVPTVPLEPKPKAEPPSPTPPAAQPTTPP